MGATIGRTAAVAWLAMVAVGCGGSDGGGADGGSIRDGGAGGADAYVGDGSELDTAMGCAGVFNPAQVLRYDLDMSAGDWSAVLADSTYTNFVSAQLSCEGAGSITVGVRRKRSGGTNKVGLKIDINQVVPGQRYFDLRKLSFENGVSEGSTEDEVDAGTYIKEYLAWRLMAASGLASGRAALAELYVNGDVVGVYVNVEQVDKRFLDDRLGDDSGWLFKKSGGINDGLKTHEADGLDNPHDDYLCFWQKSAGCAVPGDVLTELPNRVDLDQMLRMGAANAVMSNSDSPLFKDNNYYWYDYDGGKRTYIPWDLDTVMNRDVDVLTGGVGGQTDMYTVVLFPTWEPEYRAILGELLVAPFSMANIAAELAMLESASSAAFARDPFVTSDAASAAASLEQWWTDRLAAVQGQL